MIKHIKIFLVVIIIIAALFYVGVLFNANSSYSYRVRNTQMNYARAKSSIDYFHSRIGRNPNSLAEMREYAKEYPKEQAMRTVLKEYISDPNGNSAEYDTLNGQGGWYYNPNTGKIKVNITEPVSGYFKWYFGPQRNTIPAEW